MPTITDAHTPYPLNLPPSLKMDPSSLSPTRLSERRGKPELQILNPASPTQSSKVIDHSSFEIPSILSPSAPSTGEIAPDAIFDTPALSTPATPTDFPPLKGFSSPFGGIMGTSSIVGTSIMEEEEGCQGCEECVGLGLEVMDPAEAAPTFTSLDSGDTSICTASFEDSNPTTSHYYNDEKLAPVTMPPTPPSQSGEHLFGFSGTPSDLHADAFACGPTPIPHSPQEPVSRATAILNKVVPPKLRASLKRRLSSPMQPTAASKPPVPALPSFTTANTPSTPPEDNAEFANLFDVPPDTPQASVDDSTASLSPNPDAILPPLVASMSTALDGMVGPHSVRSSRRNSPAGLGMSSESFPEMSQPASPTGLLSPPYPPVKSPLMSPSIASSQSSLINSTTPCYPTHGHKKARSIDPATPLVAVKATDLAPPTEVTADSLADLIEEMNNDLAAYDLTLTRMTESGWSSPQEIKNVELQRAEQSRMWQQRIAESKKILEGTRRSEAQQHAAFRQRNLSTSAMSSVSSFETMAVTSTVGNSAGTLTGLGMVTQAPVNTNHVASLMGSQASLVGPSSAPISASNTINSTSSF